MSERDMFIIYFSGLCAFQYHPRNADNFASIDLLALSVVALEMCRITTDYFPEV